MSKVLVGVLIGVLLTLQVGAGGAPSETLRSRVKRLEQKTRALNSYGDLKADHILTPVLCTGDPAEWTSNEQGIGC